ncbi:Ig heavy chain Mem5-like [Stegastes partitus]|uniref:Ig heavy chain Mem5-like n=1 Tax=Stegastes partitus TaxID=144197 RepID=A0A3B4ZSI2_9TELE|nr:PREDICTED: Ig heavy chain Mem5-like [Stegastes partitus]
MHPYVIICGVFHLSAVIQSQTLRQDTGVKAVTVGDDVTLFCFYNSQVAMHFSWYRQQLGSKPELLSTIYKFGDSSKVFSWLEKNPRFTVERDEGMNHLKISDIQLSDSATYYCGSSHSNMVEFGEGVFLSVKGATRQHQGIIQEPASETIPPGGSVSLNCTVNTGFCDDEPSVYWFRHGSRQGILHAHRDRCKPVSAPAPPSQNCVYHLQKVNLSSSDAGTYYCAVASCGEILFGNGSTLLVGDAVEDQVAQIRILAWLSIIRTGILLFFLTVCLIVYVSKTC